jgi:hypothetical protein
MMPTKNRATLATSTTRTSLAIFLENPLTVKNLWKTHLKKVFKKSTGNSWFIKNCNHLLVKTNSTQSDPNPLILTEQTFFLVWTIA